MQIRTFQAASTWNNYPQSSLSGSGTPLDDDITLLDGTTISSQAISFDYNSYHVYWDMSVQLGYPPDPNNETDITNDMRQNDKASFIPNFNRQTDSARAYNEQPATGGGTGVGPATPLPTSTLQILGSQLYNDPFSAPLQQVDKTLANAGKTIASSTGITSTAVIGLGVLALVVLIASQPRTLQLRT